MGEALITRQGGINSEMMEKIEDIELKDSNWGTVLVTFKDPDDKPIVGEILKMVDHGGTSINYTTNEKGQCLFKTQSGQMTINDRDFTSKYNYIDMLGALDKTIDTPVGTVTRIDMVRRIRGNGYSINISSSRWVNFSRFIDRINVTISGGGGSGYATWSLVRGVTVNTGPLSATNKAHYDTYYLYYTPTYSPVLQARDQDYNNTQSGGSGYINSITMNPSGNYYITIGAGGKGVRSPFHANSYAGSNWSYGYSNYRLNFNENGSSTIATTALVVPNRSLLNGNAGQTTSFGSIISAVGGVGGIKSGTPVVEGGGAAGGSKNATFSINDINCYHYEDDYTDANLAKTYGNIHTPDGSSGWCNISNFRYKI